MASGGFFPVRKLDGGNFITETFISTDSTVIAPGDLVTLTGTAAAHPVSGRGLIASVTRAGATDAIVGVVQAVSPVGLTTIRPYRYKLASTTRLVHVVIATPTLVLQVAEDNDSNDLAATHVGLLINSIDATPDAVAEHSAQKIDSSSTSGAVQFRIHGLPEASFQGAANALGTGAVWEVTPVKTVYGDVAGVAI